MKTGFFKRGVIKIIYLLKVSFHFIYSPKYKIKRGYIHRNSVPHFNDTQNKDEWQKEVYVKVKEIINDNKYSTVCDIGCGSGFKLLNYLNEFKITGVEVEPTLSHLMSKYPDSEWKDLERIYNQHFDIIILADVIEHVENPQLFLKNIIDNISFHEIVISTPDRSLMTANNKFGPPLNIHHYREWTSKEFRLFIESFLFIKTHYISNKEQYTQVIIAKKP